MPVFNYKYFEVKLDDDEYIELQYTASGTVTTLRLRGNGDIYFTGDFENTTSFY